MMYAADFRQQAREGLRGRWPLAILTTLVAGLLGGVPGSGSAGSGGFGEGSLDMEAIHQISPDFLAAMIKLLAVLTILGLVAFIIGGVITLGYCLFSLDVVDKQSTRFGVIFSQFHRFGDGFCLRLLTALYTFLWMLLFIIPGIVAVYSYAMAPYIMAENPNCTAGQALTESKEMMRGNRFRLFCLEISFFGWCILGVLTLGIGFLWINPYMAVSRAAFYREISGTGISVKENSETPVTLEY
jgi:uncharacterized membrane protein